MNTDAYEKLAHALNRLPGGFPQTRSRVELKILRKIFSPDEALVASHLTGTSEAVDAIAQRAGLPEAEVEKRLKGMLVRNIVIGYQRDGVWRFRLMPYVVGIYEAQWDVLDHEMAHLSEQYWNEGGAEGIMRYQPALHRVVPAQRALKTEVILPYDDVKQLLAQAKSFELRDCLCRKQEDLLGKRKCDFPLKNCLNFLPIERPWGPHSVTREEALKVLDETEEIGLVHCVSNVAKGVFYVCNCCGCCCGIMKGITQFGIEDSVARANYYAVVDPDKCLACGICVDRCQVKAITLDEIAKIDLKKCIGCGLCVTGCPDEAVSLKPRPDAEIMPPPSDQKDWEQQRLKNRGLLK